MSLRISIEGATLLWRLAFGTPPAVVRHVESS